MLAKQMIQKLAHRCGYRISRLSCGKPAYHALAEMNKNIAEPVIFDVGAYHGHVSKAFRALFPASMIYAFEPSVESFDTLKTNVAQDPGIQIFNFGLSDQDGERSFHVNSKAATNSLLSTDDLGAKTWGAGLLDTKRMIHAQFRTVDSVMKEFNVPRVDILKLDVQGAEYLVMKGAQQTCRLGLIQHVYSEIITQPTYQGQKRFDEALAVFLHNGFDLHNFYNMDTMENGQLRQVDVIFTKKANPYPR